MAFAKSLGLAPHADYKKGARVFGGINPKDATARYTFGKDGKPYYIFFLTRRLKTYQTAGIQP